MKDLFDHSSGEGWLLFVLLMFPANHCDTWDRRWDRLEIEFDDNEGYRQWYWALGEKKLRNEEDKIDFSFCLQNDDKIVLSLNPWKLNAFTSEMTPGKVLIMQFWWNHISPLSSNIPISQRKLYTQNPSLIHVSFRATGQKFTLALDSRVTLFWPSLPKVNVREQVRQHLNEKNELRKLNV